MSGRPLARYKRETEEVRVAWPVKERERQRITLSPREREGMRVAVLLRNPRRQAKPRPKRGMSAKEYSLLRQPRELLKREASISHPSEEAGLVAASWPKTCSSPQRVKPSLKQARLKSGKPSSSRRCAALSASA